MTAPAMPSEGDEEGYYLTPLGLFVVDAARLLRLSPTGGTMLAVSECAEALMQSERAAARPEALEEAAKIADEYGWAAAQGDNADLVDKMRHSDDDADEIAARIRSLSAPPQKTQEEMTDG